jgi:hypothetical protein
MLNFERLDIIIASVGGPDVNANVMTCWELITQHSGLDATTFAVERSLSPKFAEGEITELVTGIAGVPGQLVYSFTDITPNLINWWRLYFYRVRADTPEGVVYSEARTWESSPRPHELAIIERHDFVLKYLQGAPSFAFIERTAESAKCPECYDATAGRVRRSDCTICLGTGRQRPYLDPIFFYADYNPDEKLTQIASFGEMQQKEKDCWFSAYPQLKPGDLIYEVQQGVLWRIARMTTVQPQGTSIQHIARIGAVGRDEVEYMRLPQHFSPEELKEIVREWEEIKQERMF